MLENGSLTRVTTGFGVFTFGEEYTRLFLFVSLSGATMEHGRDVDGVALLYTKHRIKTRTLMSAHGGWLPGWVGVRGFAIRARALHSKRSIRPTG